MLKFAALFLVPALLTSCSAGAGPIVTPIVTDVTGLACTIAAQEITDPTTKEIVAWACGEVVPLILPLISIFIATQYDSGVAASTDKSLWGIEVAGSQRILVVGQARAQFVASKLNSKAVPNSSAGAKK